MTSIQFLSEIRKLPAAERLQVVETILQEIRKDLQQLTDKRDTRALQQQMRAAAEVLLQDYLNDPELTVFTSLDGEEVHEAR
jgi:vacuolar-type H+-ATPase subunit E/Vma4